MSVIGRFVFFFLIVFFLLEVFERVFLLFGLVGWYGCWVLGGIVFGRGRVAIWDEDEVWEGS